MTMKEYVLLFHMDILTKEVQPTKEQMEVYMQQWMQWINDIDEKGQLALGGNYLNYNGKVVRANNVVTDEPYVSNKESVAGYIIIHAKDMDNALVIAQKCPILKGEGTSVEVREIAKPG